jgi:hypothetical protein
MREAGGREGTKFGPVKRRVSTERVLEARKEADYANSWVHHARKLLTDILGSQAGAVGN